MNAILPPIAGLYQLAATLRGQVKWNRDNARWPQTDPRFAHEAEVRATSGEAKAAQCGAHIRSNAALIPLIELIIHDLTTSTIQSAPRTLALGAMEHASMILRRELGDAPAEHETRNLKREREEEEND